MRLTATPPKLIYRNVKPGDIFDFNGFHQVVIGTPTKEYTIYDFRGAVLDHSPSGQLVYGINQEESEDTFGDFDTIHGGSWGSSNWAEIKENYIPAERSGGRNIALLELAKRDLEVPIHEGGPYFGALRDNVDLKQAYKDVCALLE